MSQSYQDILCRTDRATAAVTIGQPGRRAAFGRQPQQTLIGAAGSPGLPASHKRRVPTFARREKANN